MKKPTKKELIAELKERRLAGDLMSNICFNLSQLTVISETTQKSMEDCYKAWDKIKYCDRKPQT